MELELNSTRFAEELAESLEHDEIIADALKRHVSLVDYAKHVEQELAHVEAESVRDYVEQSSKVAVLHAQMRKCDEGLGRIQGIVGRFSAQLGGVAGEVRRVQEASRSMTLKLANRSAAETALSAYLRRLVLPTDMESVVENSEVFNDVFVGYAALVDARLDELGREPRDTKRYVAARETVAGDESRHRLHAIKNRLAQRAGDALLSAIGELRCLPHLNTGNVLTSMSPGGTSASARAAEATERAQRVLRRESLTRYGGPLLAFLEKRATPAALEVRGAYIDAASKALHSLIKAYNEQLGRHGLLLANKHDLVAIEESAVRSSVTSKVSLAKRGDAFSIGDRESVLKDLDAPALRASEARADKAKLPSEALFRSSLKRFRDACACEHHVALALFGSSDADGVFSAVVHKAGASTIEHLEHRTKEGHDVVGLALAARLLDLARAKDVCAARLPLDAFYDNCDKVVWPRLEAAINANIDSVKKANPDKLGVLGVSPHYVTRRFAELAAALITLFPGDRGKHLRLSVTETLRDEVLALLAKLTTEQFPDDTNQHYERVVFLANSYDQVVRVLDERLPPHRMTAEHDDVKHQLAHYFRQLLGRQRDAYVDATLHDALGSLVAFVEKTERLLSTGPCPPLDQDFVHELATHFASNWESLLAKINDDVLASFSNFVNGTQVLKQCFTKLLLYYTSFQDIVRKAWRRPPPFVKDFVSTAAILSEIKKYTRSFS